MPAMSRTAGAPGLLPSEEEAERVAGGVEHDADAFGVAVRRLPRRFRATGLERRVDGCLEVLDLNLEVKHLRLFARPLRPRGRLVPCLALDVEVDATRGSCGLTSGTWQLRDCGPGYRKGPLGGPLSVTRVGL